MQFNAMAPIIELPEPEWRLWCVKNWPYQSSIQFAIPVGTITSNSPDTNSVAWSDVIIEYAGNQYTITDGNTSDKYLYWELATPTVFAHSATIPTISENLIVVGINTTGDFQPSWKAGQAAVVANTVSATAIDGMTITGATIQTEATASRGIKLTSTTLKGYDGSGNEKFSLTASTGAVVISGGTITGPTLQTETTADRGIKLTSSAFTGYDSSGNTTFSIASSTGKVTATSFSGTDAYSIFDIDAGGAFIFRDGRNTSFLKLRTGVTDELIIVAENSSPSSTSNLTLSADGTNNVVKIANNLGDDVIATFSSAGLSLSSGDVYKINNTQVVGAQGAAVADATDAVSTTARLNDLLSRLRAHGLIAT